MLSIDEALRQNPENVCPPVILKSIGLMEVQYYGFDGVVHMGQIAVNHAVMTDIDAFFKNAVEMQFPIAKVIPAAYPDYHWSDELLMADNVSSAFNYRLIAGTDRPSLHARGLAFDINPVQNPYIRYTADVKAVQPPGATYSPEQPGTLHADHALVKLMEGLGWEWGGHWKPDSGRTDYQHFQKQV